LFYREFLAEENLKCLWELNEIIVLLFPMCSSRKYPYPPQRRLMEIQRGRGISKAQPFKAV